MTENFEGAREGEFRYKKCILNVEAFSSCLGVTSLHRQGITSLNKSLVLGFETCVQNHF